ncbi:tetratricopeptide repeat protein [Rhodopseudomonas pseudopalustris]|uniref:Tetratricopeptide repeat-containing protein n=1 Tax=Rhodopseudomonas pseudopalustris TaxID=1513892 RepID=A0A1H8VCC3_9BRAD|nr:tetratricopeptide repeat protein [Rhodopseudomonas pseudopalustris]SEP12961.1 Tetratricopeptide repeat-containing protein [Rhodopseudomonas pseudopalustris]
MRRFSTIPNNASATRRSQRLASVAAIAFVAAALLIAAPPARADAVEVAPGVQVTRKTYSAPVNQQPFFGFAAKTPEQRAADEKFVSALVAATGSRQKAFEETSLRGWRAISKGNASEAALRFNQAYLLAPDESAVYHGFAIVAMMRFNDIDYADELFKRARKQPHPLKPLLADHGRALLIAKRPQEARAVLEQAIADTPDLADAWSNLGFARLQAGDAAAACAAADEAGKRKPSSNVASDLALLRNTAQCK